MDPLLAKRVAEVLAARGDVALAIAFGSRARGAARPDSDLDLACDVDPGRALALAADVSSAVGLEVDVVPLASANIPLLESLLRDGVTVFERTPGRGATFRARLLSSMELDRPWLKRMQDAFVAHLASGAE